MHKENTSSNACDNALSLSRTYAVPSWVMAGTIYDNAHFILAKNREAQSLKTGNIATKSTLHIAEIGLCFFETASCIAYTEDDLPMALVDLPFTWHVHLPSDLPWSDGGRAAARIALELMDKVAFLGARRAVLHPPVCCADEAVLLCDFMSVWVASGRCAEDVHIENIDGHDLLSLWPTIETLGCRVCLDTGHLLAYRQDALRDFLLGLDGVVGNVESEDTDFIHFASYNKAALARVGMMHLCGVRVNGSGRHAPLTVFGPAERAYIAAICGAVPCDTVMMLELFTWEHVVASWPLVREWV
ncbi:MAG: cobamide remodeling phosphodiesterase CbiR [Pseudomonadota bacterium]